MSVKDCLDCPSALPSQEAGVFFGIKDAPTMCARFGHALGPAGEAFEGATTSYANGCVSFGKDAPTSPPSSLSLQWFTPRPDLLTPTNTVVNSCEDCRNHCTQANQTAELIRRLEEVDGAGACAATGRLILKGREVIEAKSCMWAEPLNGGTYQRHLEDPLDTHQGGTVVFVRSATSTVQKSAAKSATPKSPKPQSLDPLNYSSDAPVADEHKDMIQAWRKVTTPRGKVHYLPIFKTSYFGDRAELIPSTKSEHSDPSLYQDHSNFLLKFVTAVYVKDMNLVSIGEPGTGKTVGWEWIAWLLNMPFFRIAYTDTTDPDEVLGIFQYDPSKGTYLDPGVLPINWELPGVLLSDEPNLAQEAIMQVYRSMNDSSRTLRVYKEAYKRHDYCFHGMAINPHWDFRNIGAKPMASADSRRLAFHWMPNPDAKQLTSIITNTVEKLDKQQIDKTIVKTIVSIGEDLREMSKQGTLSDFWTVSQEIKVARLVEELGLEAAYRCAYFDYVDPGEAEIAMGLIRSKVPYGVDWA